MFPWLCLLAGGALWFMPIGAAIDRF